MTQSIRNERIVHTILALSAVVLLLVSSNLNWHKETWKTVLTSDARGYYAYLPAVLIYHDLNFGFFEEIENGKYHDELIYYDYRANHKGIPINKYFVGTAIAELPFFLAAHAVAHIQEADADGYSKPYMVWMTLPAILYVWLGMVWMNGWLKRYSISATHRVIVLLSFVFGTNMFLYTVHEPGMSHIYSFAFVSAFLLAASRWFDEAKPTHLIASALALGMITLIRPVNILIVLAFPFLAGSWSNFIGHFSILLRQWKTTLLSTVLFAAVVSIQPLLYYLATGSFWIYSYGSEGFNFLNPHILDFLISYKKGFFLYAPLALIALIAGMVWWKRSRFERFALISFLAFIVYVLASWWNWWYGGSFGSRVMIEFMPFFMLLLALALKEMGSMAKRITFVLIFASVAMCQIQSFQYRYFIIHWENTDKDAYWDVFLQLDKKTK